MKIYDKDFFSACENAKVSFFTGKSSSAAGMAKRRLIQRGILPAQLAERAWRRRSYWLKEDDPVGRAVQADSLRRSGFSWGRVAALMNVPPLALRLQVDSFALLRLSGQEIRERDWQPTIKAFSYVFEHFGVGTDWVTELKEEEQRQIDFLCHAVFLFHLEGGFDGEELLTRVKEEIRGVESRMRVWGQVSVWLSSDLGINIGGDVKASPAEVSASIFLLGIVGKDGLNADEVISVLSGVVEKLDVVTVKQVVDTWSIIFDVSRELVRKGRGFNTENLVNAYAKRVQELSV